MFLCSIQRLKRLRFFSRNDQVLSTWRIIAWWEIRRIPYNFLVGIAGIVTTLLCIGSGLIGERVLGVPIGIPDPPLFAVFAVIAYGIMANICYTGGWISEIIVAKVWQDQGHHFGEISFFLGVLFSIGLTLLAGVVVVGVLIIELLINIFRTTLG
ncbi:MAG: hypothetical protein WBN53_14800 [Thermodesulfobacteriota bacterium]